MAAVVNEEAPADTDKSLLCWIIDDRHGAAQMAINGLGIRIGAVVDTFKLASKGLVRSFLIDLDAMRPDLLLIALFAGGAPRGNNHDHRVASALAQMVQTQLNAGGQVLIESRPRNTTWHMIELNQLITDPRLKSMTVRWCNLGLVEKCGKPCGRFSRVLTTGAFLRLASCDCVSHNEEIRVRTQKEAEQNKLVSTAFWRELLLRVFLSVNHRNPTRV